MTKIKPLTLAIRTLISFSFVSPQVRAELPIPSANVTLSNKPVEIATQGQATATISGQNLTIQQGSEKAVLNWQKFNIGAENAVNFQQPSANSVALNNIHQADASKIMGKLTANGQVYLVNQNGFVFSKDSQVNVNSLVASTLGISDAVFQKGIANAFNNDGSAALEGGNVVLKDASGNPLKDANGNPIKVEILISKGASIKTNANGGRVIIAAPVITNEGDIETPDGQAILAASKDKVYLQEAGADSSTRGLVVEVGKGGEVNNVGKVLAERGNASLLGFAVNQKGIVSATTSVKLNGSVRLLAREGIQDKAATGGKLLPQSTTRAENDGDGLGTTAKVTLSENSKTSVDLSTDKTETAIDAQAQTPSNIEISAHDVNVQKNATIQAKSGNVKIEAIDHVNDPLEKGTARISLDENSNIDVSGVKDVALPVSKNIVTVETRKNELRDAPLQRDGILYGKKVTVDVREASVKRDTDGNVTSATIPVADIKGAVDRIERNIDERSTSGGKISLKSSGDVIAKSGSNVDFSGGSIKYQDGTIETTQLTSNGQAFAIEKADPNLKYDGILTQQYTAKGYVEGKAGGSLNIETYETKLDGALKGETVSGIYQRDANAVSGSTLAIDLSRNNLLSKQGVNFVDNSQSLPPLKGGGGDVLLSTQNLKNSGISNVQIKANGAVSLEKDTKISLPNFGSLTIAAKNFDIQGQITAPSGRVNLSPIKVDGNFLPSALTLGESAIIDVAGFWVNDYADTENGKTLSQLALNGGTVALQTEQGNLNLAKNSRIDVSGGAWLNGQNKIVSGQGGAISLNANSHDASGNVSNLLLNGTVQGYGATQGGTLNLTSNEVVIGSKTENKTTTPLLLNPEFFNQNGFANYSATSYLNGVTVADNSQIKLQQQNIQFKSNASSQQTGSRLSDIGDIVTLPNEVRNPTDLTLSVSQTLSQNRDSVLTIGKNAQILGDRQATINLNSDTSILVNGKIDAPAGNINLTIEPPTAGDSGFFATQGIWLNEGSQLSAKGDFKPQLNSLNLTMGDVLNGGNVNLIAKRGFVVTNEKSTIDVSGTQKELDFIQVENGQQKFVKQIIPSRGGAIGLKAGEGIIADGQLLAKGAVGGTLNVELNSGLRSKPDIAIDSGLFPDDENSALERVIEISTNSNNLTAQSGRAFFSNQRLNDAGFATLNFKTDVINANGDYAGGVLFNGDVVLNAPEKITLDTPQIQTVNAKVILNTAYAALGSTQSRLDTDLGDGTFSTTLAPDSIRGDGQLTVSAKNIDLIGGLSFKNFNHVTLNSENDLRATGIRIRSDSKNYLGELKLDGDLTLSAAQVYPSTLSDYKFSIAGDNSTVTIQNSSAKTTPVYSAAGHLTINAANIIQSGTLKAPFGTINLNAVNKLELTDGSVTSVSGDGVTVPFGKGSGGLNWLYPFDDAGSVALVIDTPPEKRLALSGKDVLLDKGANVNLNGGGDLYAYEFIPGIGGSTDTLKTKSSEKFAVIPDLGHALTPYDPLESTDSNIKVGDSVYLNAADNLAAGWYTILPAHYALLPNAYLITPLANTKDWSPTQTAKNIAGTTVVAGRFGNANADIKNPRWQGFAVESGKIARTYSEYTDYFANDFFAEKAVKAIESVSQQLPQDAGNLVLNAQTSLSLNSNLFTLPEAKGKGSFVDISANNLAIVSRREDVANSKDSDVVSLFVDDLNNLNAPSLLLGGTRSKNKNGEVVTVTAQNVTIAENAKLKGSELLLAATDSLTVSKGAEIQSTGKSDLASSKLELTTNKQITETVTDEFGIETENVVNSSDSAFLCVSSAEQSDLVRTGRTTGETGVLTVEKGAILQSGNSMLLDANKDTIFAGDIKMDGGSLALNANKISLGNAPENTDGLVLTSPKFTLDELKLNSRTSLDIYGAVELTTKELWLDSAAIRGFDNLGKTAIVTADNLTLSNSHAPSVLEDGNGTGSLAFNARNIQFGSGDYSISGFQNINFNASENIKGIGQTFASQTGNSILSNAANLRVAANVNATSPQFISGNGATTNIDATGFEVKLDSATPNNNSTQTAGLGGLWNIQADKIDSSANFELPSGVLKLNAQKGDVALNSGSVDVSGREMTFGDSTQLSPAGKIELSSTNNVSLANSATLNTGVLSVSAPQGQFNWNGNVKSNQGSLELNAKNLGNFSTLNTKIAAAGFSDKIDLTQNSGNVTISETDKVKANEFNLAANQGNVAINGSIDSKEIAIRGNDGISLSGKIFATNVTLDTVHQNDAGSGLLDLSAKGSIDASTVHLRTSRNDNAKTVNVSAINTTIKSENVVLEATRVYENQSDINSETITQIQTDTANFMNVAPKLKNNSGAKISLSPSVELRSDGDLTLSTTWDFASKITNEETGKSTPNWRFDDGQGNKNVAGFLTLNAKGDVLINASLTDAFANGALLGTDPENIYQDVLQTGASWSYKISAGKDVKVANAYYPLDEYGEPAYDAAQVLVRTGTGSIAVSAGGNIEFVKDAENTKASAAIYTAGKPAEFTKTQLLNGEIAGVPAQKTDESEADYLNRLDANEMNTLLRYGYVDENLIGLQFRTAEYPTQGGSVSLNAGKNISGINTGQEISDWLVRSGVIAENNRPTAWGLNLSGDSANGDKGVHFFNQNIGALGGGNVTINAGGDISNLSAMLPTTGKPFGKLSNESTNQWTQTGTVINGGGNLTINAGNNIVGGEYFVALGTAKLNAGGSVLGSGNTNLGALVELGDADFNIQARQNVVVGSVFNPTVLQQNVLLPNRIGESRFFTYGENSSVSLSSTAGNITLQNDIAAIKTAKGRENDSETGFEYAVYPASLKVAALSGDVNLDHSMTLLPAANGKLELLAGNNIGADETAGQVISINMSDADPALLPSVQNPTQQMEGSLSDGLIRTREYLDASTPNPRLVHAEKSLFLNNESTPKIIAKSGNIAFSSNSDVTFFLPKAAQFSAGQDIQNLSFAGQNLKDSDITKVSAGRDITFDAIVDENGNVQANDKQFELAGAGELQVQAGRNISLGGSAGINTIGNTKNTVLSPEGASISLISGSTNPVEKSALTSLFETIKTSAASAAAATDADRKALYQKGYDAIELLFPKKAEAASGNVSLVFSQIKTLAGGDINLAVPNGEVNVGLAGSLGGIKKGADKLGIVAQQSGDLNAFTSGNFNVNQSRVFTMGGGDIAIWSSQGNIDAGKGAKSAISAPAPITSIDSQGNIVTIFPPVVSGSGIQTITPQIENAKQGNVYLAAPSGIVDAGEAGISGGKIVIAANAVVGASNISASGGSVGVPTSVPTPSVSGAASSAAASAAKSATQTNEDSQNKNSTDDKNGSNKKKAVVSFISTDVIGYGNCSAAEVRDGKEGCGN
ncbi:MAG: filamentous hemagglutinin family protein [Methylococcales bacterium]|nr:filamentous hemagglutinin family protein [Methylococcales bacterium]